MTYDEAISKLKGLSYKYISSGLLHTELYDYKPENLQVLKECQKDMPSLHIYEDVKKFRLIISLK